MSAPHALIEFFQKEAMEYLGRLDQLLIAAGEQAPDPAALLTNARALRGSALQRRQTARRCSRPPRLRPSWSFRPRLSFLRPSSPSRRQ